jgi:hypothetical protein
MNRPKWMQDINGPWKCSICKSDKVYFEDFSMVEEDASYLGIPISHIHYGYRCYCKECFEEYGGNDYVKGLSTDPNGPKSSP